MVGHGAREAIEVFELNAGGALPTMKWIGCIPEPEGTRRINSVAALPGGYLGATNFDAAGGELWEWHPTTGWIEVPGSQMRGPNGLVSSDDGQWFYVGGWSDRALVRLSRGQTPVRADPIPVGFNVDNVRWGSDGKVIVAGHVTRCEGAAPCELAAARVAEVDPNTFAIRQLVDLWVFPLLKSLLPVVVAFLLPTTDTLDHRRVGNGTHRHGLFQEPMEELPAMA